MQLNATLLGQFITFAIFVWFCMKFIWPRLTEVIRERQKLISDGLMAASKSQEDLDKAKLEVRSLIDNAKKEANQILEKTQKQAQGIIDEAKLKAKEEAYIITQKAHKEIENNIQTAKETLYRDIANLSFLGAEKVIGYSINKKENLEHLFLEIK